MLDYSYCSIHAQQARYRKLPLRSVPPPAVEGLAWRHSGIRPTSKNRIGSDCCLESSTKQKYKGSGSRRTSSRLVIYILSILLASKQEAKRGTQHLADLPYFPHWAGWDLQTSAQPVPEKKNHTTHNQPANHATNKHQVTFPSNIN